jgi:phosphoribosyl 1,2-cyclic phosphodiesterase
MKTETIVLTFLGTRGEIEARSRRHRRHSSLLIQSDDARIMIDCGADWLDQMPSIRPTAIVLTHAHPDHAAGLAKGAPCPVYATKETLDLIGRYPIDDRRRVLPRRTLAIGSVKFKAFPVEHSIRAPAVGYRVLTKAGSLFYLPDVANLPNAASALHGATLYVGDGATIKRSMVRKRNGKLIGHATIAVQLGWCAMAHVGRAIFTHCGSPIVRADARKSNASIRRLGHEYGVDAQLACDGDRLAISYDGRRRRMFWMPKP